MNITKRDVFNGCGCLSIGFVLMFFALIVWAIFADDETETESDSTKQDSTVVQQPKDSVVVNEPLEGDPYEELDELIGLENVKEEVRSLANFVKIQKQR